MSWSARNPFSSPNTATHLKELPTTQTTAALSQLRDIPSPPSRSHGITQRPDELKKATCSTRVCSPLAPATGAGGILAKPIGFLVCPFPESHGITESARLAEIFKILQSHHHSQTMSPIQTALGSFRGGDSTTSQAALQPPAPHTGLPHSHLCPVP